MADDYPRPGPNEFSADEEKAMRAAKTDAKIKPDTARPRYGRVADFGSPAHRVGEAFESQAGRDADKIGNGTDRSRGDSPQSIDIWPSRR